MDTQNASFIVKRPYSHETLGKHLRETLRNLGSVTRDSVLRAQNILDVGFGELRRSTLALRSVFPDATIHAIDNDVRLVNQFADPKNADAAKTRYLFGDAELWLPATQYDLVVVSLVSHAFHDAERAIANLVESNLKEGGYLLFIHRTDAIMHATVRLDRNGAENAEVKAVQAFWKQIDSIWKTRVGSQLELASRTQYICRHDKLAALCAHLAVTEAGNSVAKNYRREKDEQLASLFGNHDTPPQYQAPREAWHMFASHGIRSAWPKPEDTVVQSEIELSSFLYQKTAGGQKCVKFCQPPATTPSRFVHLAIRPDQPPDDKEFVQSVLNQMPDARDSIRDFYYIKGDQKPLSLLKEVDAESKLPGNLEANLLTKALQVSGDIWQQHRGNHEFLFFMFPALHSSSSLVSKYVSPASATNVLGWKAQDTYLIPLLNEAAPIETQLRQCKFADLKIAETAQYLRARGEFARENGCVAIYYVIFRSRLLDKDGNFQAISFLAKNWLPIEAIRSIANVAYAFLLAMEEQRVIKMFLTAEEREQDAEKKQKALSEQILNLTKKLEALNSLDEVLKLIAHIDVQRHDPAFSESEERLVAGVKVLRAKIILAALESEANRVAAAKLVYPSCLRSNDSVDAMRWLLNAGEREMKEGKDGLKPAIQNIIKTAGKDPSAPEYKQLVEKFCS